MIALIFYAQMFAVHFLITTFVLRFFLQMKKLLFLVSLFASAFAVLGSINTFHEERRGNVIDNSTKIYAAKYEDCIDKTDFPVDFVSDNKDKENNSDWDIKKVDNCINKYGNSIEATIKNLNHIDAHNYIHQEFNRSKNAILAHELSDIQIHYHREVMRICYASDKALNLGSAGRL